MKFHFSEIVLWLKNGHIRRLSFRQNMVNVITGDSNTGKSAILQIIDYCLFASGSKISESVINENVLWYGIVISINDKVYTIARRAFVGRVVSMDYYFSSCGEIPKMPISNSGESIIKPILEIEFGINGDVVMPFGGKSISAGSKISLRYFLMFNTISQDIITSSNVFFDKQNEDRYREALPRVFDIAVGIDDISNVLAREQREQLEKRVRAEERKRARTVNKASDFKNEMTQIVSMAKEYDLVDPDLDIGSAIKSIKALRNGSEPSSVGFSQKYDSLKLQENRLKLIIKNLKHLKYAFSAYKDTLEGMADSLKPIEFLKERKSELIVTGIFNDVIGAISQDFELIKRDTRKMTPIDTDLDGLIARYSAECDSVSEALSEFPIAKSSAANDREKLIFIGEAAAKLDLYEADIPSLEDGFGGMDELSERLNSIVVRDVAESRRMFTELLEEIISKAIESTDGVMENYATYHPVFDYASKQLQLRKPMTDYIENIGSSSNHMFLHLFLFLGLHEAIIRKSCKFVPAFLVIDQPSRPYWGEGDNKRKNLLHSDIVKVKKAFELMDSFVKRIVEELGGEFQMIVFEHVPPTTWSGLDRVHLVETFIDGNALIPMG